MKAPIDANKVKMEGRLPRQPRRARKWQLDPLDEAIIGALQEDANRTNASIAMKVDSTESTVRRRREALIKNGVVRITAVVDPLRIGYQVMALIGLQVDGRKLHQAEAALTRMSELRFVGLTLGRYDILTEAWFASTEGLLDFVTERLNKVPGVLRSETLQIAKLVKYGYDWGQST